MMAMAMCLAGADGLRHREDTGFNPLKEIFAVTTRAPFGCRKPRDDEKIVYWVVHAEPEEANDGGLTETGKEQAEQLREDPRLEFALSKDPKYRAQAIIMAPNRKSMETGMVAFKDGLKDATWDFDPDIKGKGEHNDAIPSLGEPMLQQYGASTELVGKYREHYDHVHMGTHADRFTRFVAHLHDRPERNIIVIATDYEAHLAGAELGDGEVRTFALANSKDDADKHGWGAFRMLSKPQRWAHCHEAPKEKEA
eukprot:CAMPEP_0204532790 /NCGR_PEP_ID=MMETSP0661-20131031/11915_1 /ASSEMBLY_ACC=CAM_ASM_000606 /TAXON_ID=109239 /ORGANISM="Alexandrium margalefi, Strain AMGDE01CS-322" /LENGTH=252 /DNA_ID=CAMNT_0051539059 /DNA_START=67 /DNA_END=825 /DNA_ORIENTATION=+